MVSTTYLDAMRATARRAGNERGIRFYSDETTSVRWGYAELDERARARAAALTDLGYGPGDVAVLAFDPGMGFIESVWAAIYAGMTIAPVPVTAGRNIEAVAARLAAITADAGSRLVLTESSVRAVVDAAEMPGVEIRLLEGPDLSLVDAWVPPRIDGDSVVLLQYTSGSTGAPKGVTVTHANLVANEEAIAAAVVDDENSVWVGWLPHYHDMGLIGLLLRPIYGGADAVLTSPSRFLRRPLFWLRLITRHRGTFTVAPDFAYRLCTQVVTDEQLAELDLSSLTHVVTGAEPIKVDTTRDFSARFAAAGFDSRAFIPAYGMAETTLIISAAAGDGIHSISADAGALESGDLLPAVDARSVDLVLCGPPVPGSTVAVVDPVSHEWQPDGRVGEIWVHGPSVARGYWNRPLETAETFGVRIVGDDLPYLRTGDLGAIVDGQIVITGRQKDLIISHGRNIYPQDVEATASREVGTDPGCLSAAFALEGQASEVGIAVEVDPRTLSSADLPAMSTDVRRAIARDFGLPSIGIALVRKGLLPRTTSGKIQRGRVRAALLTGEITVAHTDGLTIDRRDDVDAPVG
ncbi:fatty acyl-AMP ligase [Microbacterium aurantiacum]|uniref:Fatty acyl-AMP ligase n=1 Tax=Microbacterium aurantiacum TaxID=162393 RepID=A0AAJ2HEV4_9MICO|nr:fatty acyl-AMP ligase [Microbacterium aurantiacum]MDS0244222.1 fatty acyl-AMP ligase [Microbacterium aurantiacum]